MRSSHILQYITYIIAWLLLSVSGAWFFIILRDTVFKISVLAQLNPWAVRGIDRWGVFVFGLLWIVMIFTLEGYLRTSVAKDKLWERLRRVVMIVVVAAILLQASQWLINYIA